MNFAQIMGMLRLFLTFGGAAALTAAGMDGDAIKHIVEGATTPGGLLLGVAPVVVAGLWSLKAHTVAATVDRAVGMTGGAVASPIATDAPAAKAQAKGIKTHLSPNG